MAEYLDHFLPVQHLLDKAVHNAQVPLLPDIILAGELGEILGDRQHHHSRQQGDDGQGGIEHDHGHQCGRHGNDGVDDLGNALTEQLPQRIHVVGIDGHDVAVSVGIKIFDGQGFHFGKQLVAQAAHGPLADVHHDAVIGERRHHADPHDTGQADQIAGQTAEIPGTAFQHGGNIVIHQGLGKCGTGHRGDGCDDDAHDHQGKRDFIIMQHVAQDPVEHCRRRRGRCFLLVHMRSSSHAG